MALSAPSAVNAQALSKKANRNRKEQGIGIFLLIMTGISVLTTIGVILALTSETVLFFASPEVTFREFFTGTEWTPLFAEAQRSFGILPLLAGTFLITAIALLVGVPLGLGAAIFLSEFATKQVRRLIMPILEILAGIPTIVLGYFALLTVTPFLRSFLPAVETSNALSAGLVMGFMLLPTVSSISIDAMQAVPRSLREAAFGLGSTKGEVTLRVVLPAAFSGIMASVILAMSRAVGETMIVTLAAGQKPNLTINPFETVETMTAFIANTAQGDQEAGSIGSLALYAVGTMLFLITLFLNILSQDIVRRFSEKYE
ncbi:MAG: phosphate ABC transporter permease subunit PstC [Deinococcota bacterium]